MPTIIDIDNSLDSESTASSTPLTQRGEAGGSQSFGSCQYSPHCSDCAYAGSLTWCLDNCVTCKTIKKCFRDERIKEGKRIYRLLTTATKPWAFTLTAPADMPYETSIKKLFSKYNSLRNRFIKDAPHILKLELQPDTKQLHYHIWTEIQPLFYPSDIAKISSYKNIHIDSEPAGAPWKNYCLKTSTPEEIEFYSKYERQFLKQKLHLINKISL